MSDTDTQNNDDSSAQGPPDPEQINPPVGPSEILLEDQLKQQPASKA